MKRLFYLALISILTLASPKLIMAQAQSRFLFSINLAPVFSHADYSVSLPLPDPATQLPTTEFSTVTNGLNYSIGLMGWYNFSPKWSVSTGVFANHAITSTTKFIQNGQEGVINYRYNHPFSHTFKTPLQLNFRPSPKQLSPYFSLGTTFDFRGTSYVDIFGNGEYVPVKFGKAVVATPLLGAGISYQINNRLSLIAQPTIQYNLQDHSTYNYYHAYQLSLQTHLVWHL